MSKRSEEEIRTIKMEFNNFKHEIMQQIREAKDNETLMKLMGVLQQAKIRYQELLGEDAYAIDNTNEEELDYDISEDEIRNKKIDLNNQQYELSQQIDAAKDDMEYMTLRGQLQQVRKQYSDLIKVEQAKLQSSNSMEESKEEKHR